MTPLCHIIVIIKLNNMGILKSSIPACMNSKQTPVDSAHTSDYSKVYECSCAYTEILYAGIFNADYFNADIYWFSGDC